MSRQKLSYILWVFVFPGPQSFAGPPTLALALSLAPDLYLRVLALNLYLPTLAYNIITNPGSAFCRYRTCLLNLCMYLHIQITRVTDLGPEFAFTLLLVVTVTLLLVVVIVAVVISLE